MEAWGQFYQNLNEQPQGRQAVNLEADWERRMGRRKKKPKIKNQKDTPFE